MTFPAVDPSQYRKRYRYPIVATDPAHGQFAHYRPVVSKVIEHVIRWPILTQAEKDAVEAEHTATVGSAGTTTITPPGYGAAVTVRFASPKLPKRKTSGTHWEVGPITLVEEPS